MMRIPEMKNFMFVSQMSSLFQYKTQTDEFSLKELTIYSLKHLKKVSNKLLLAFQVALLHALCNKMLFESLTSTIIW